MYALICASFLLWATLLTILTDTSLLFKVHNKPTSFNRQFTTKQNTESLPHEKSEVKRSEDSFSYDLWFLINQGPLCPPLGLLKLHIIRYFTQQNHLKNNSPRNEETRNSTSEEPPALKDGEIDFIRYHSLDTIYKYIDSLQFKFPDLVHLETIGNSTENREIKLIKVSTGDVASKASILIVGGMNGNEWASTSTVLYALQQLAENPVNRYLLGNTNWYLIPIVNPDGYEYSYQKNTTWRKTRSSSKQNPNQCIGVDLNRNFNGRSNFSRANDSCNDFFAGDQPFSEPESVALSNYIITILQIQLYINVHGYGQSIEFPLGKSGKSSEDSSDLKHLAQRASYAVQKYGGRLYHVQSLNGSEPSGSEQWIRNQGIKYAYKLKLPWCVKKGPKCQVPQTEILSMAQEVFVAFREFQQMIASFYSVIYDLIGDY